jgi:DNA (cytosine-5)-methyltransferase 1
VNMKHFGLFEGIGGFSLAARWMGWETVGWCEINPFCQTVLKHHFPNAKGYGDIKTTDFRPWRGKVDILTGGFPCQDASRANQGRGERGLLGEKTGLYSQMVRAISEIRPKFVVAENVPDIIATNGGNDFAQILQSLYEVGYDAEWCCLYASQFGAPHGRERMYLVANASSIRLSKGKSFFPAMGKKIDKINRGIARATVSIGQHWNDEPPFPTLDDGVSHKLDGSRYWYDQTIQAAGNAVVPQVVHEIYKAIQSTLD